MRQTRWLGCGAGVLAALLLAGPVRTARGQEGGTSPLAHVPAKSPVVVQLRGVEQTKDRIIAMLKAAVPDLAPRVQEHLNQGLEHALSGRDLKAVNKGGPDFLILTDLPNPGAEGVPHALLLPVSSYEEFRQGFLKEDERKALKKEEGFEVTKHDDKDMYLVDLKGYVGMTQSKEVAEQLAKKPKGMDGTLDKSIAERLLGSDVAAYINMEAVNKEYGDRIKGFQQIIPAILPQFAEQAKMDKANVERLQKIIECFFQLIEDSKALVLAVDFRPDGLAIRKLLRVGADSKTNNVFKTIKPGEIQGLDKHPAGQLGYAGIQLTPDLVEMFLTLVNAASSDESKSAKATVTALKDMAAAGPEAMTADFGIPMKGLQVWNYKDPAKASEAALKMVQSLDAGGNFQNMALKEKPKTQADAKTYRDFKLHEASFVWDFEKAAQAMPQGGKEAAEAMKKMLGESMKCWFGTDGKVFVQVSAADWEAAQKLLDDYLDNKDTVGQMPPFQEARKRLPAQATAMLLLDLPQYLQVFSTVAAPMLKGQGLPIDIPELKAQKGRGYVGVSMTLEPEMGSSEVWLPAATVREVRKMLKPVLPTGGEEQEKP
jgi:hypothetical protein